MSLTERQKGMVGEMAERVEQTLNYFDRVSFGRIPYTIFLLNFGANTI